MVLLKKAFAAVCAVFAMLFMFSGAAMAAAVDIAAVTTDIGAQITPVVAIGGAVLLVVVAVKAFSWLRRALS